MDYMFSYTLPCGTFGMRLAKEEVAAVLRNVTRLAMEGHKFSNVTIKSL